MDNIEIKNKIESINEKINNIKKYINLEAINEDIKKLEEKTMEEGFWSSNSNKTVLQEISNLKNKSNKLTEIYKINEEISILFQFIIEGDSNSIPEIINNIENIEIKIENLEIELLLNEKYDINNAILSINAGAGGTEACDWVNMLFRMYERYANKNGYKVEVLDMQAGDETGLKSIVANIKGEYAYGYLKSEKGVHRLVRISPFDSNARRHTTFSAVNVIPEIEDDVDIKILSEDLIIDTYRASGAGGQHVNTTDSAVRITHNPTGIVVTCQNQRSQLQNRETAMKILKAKLFELEVEKRNQEIENIKGDTKKIEWGSQIRSYVFQPYRLVKDHRTKYEIGDIDKVMDGEIELFLQEYLKSCKNKI